jgi:hypothetical protein
MVKVSKPPRSPALSALAIRAEAERLFDTLPDDAEVSVSEAALIEGKTEGALRQQIYTGRCRYPAIKAGPHIRFNVGQIRRRRREMAAEAAARHALELAEHAPLP